MTAAQVQPQTSSFPAAMVRAQGDYPDVWGPERTPRTPARRWLHEKLATLGLGTLGHRFADPRGTFYETYTAETLAGALVEIWADDVPDFATLHAASKVRGAGTTPYDPVRLPEASMELHVWELGTRPNAVALDVRETQTRTWLRRSPELSAPFTRARVGTVLTSWTVEGEGPRSRIATQAIARHAYRDAAGYAGISYRSRHGNNENNFAIFDRSGVSVVAQRPLSASETGAIEAAERLGLYIGGGTL